MDDDLHDRVKLRRSGSQTLFTVFAILERPLRSTNLRLNETRSVGQNDPERRKSHLNPS
jgi:hypothetical protein